MGTVVDWLILQVPYAAVFEGEPLVVRCRGWYDKVVYKLHYYHDGKAVRYFHSSANYTVPQARASDSGRYQCSGTMRIPVESAPMFSAKVAVTVQGGGHRGPRREASESREIRGRAPGGQGGRGSGSCHAADFSPRPRKLSASPPLRSEATSRHSLRGGGCHFPPARSGFSLGVGTPIGGGSVHSPGRRRSHPSRPRDPNWTSSGCDRKRLAGSLPLASFPSPSSPLPRPSGGTAPGAHPVSSARTQSPPTPSPRLRGAFAGNPKHRGVAGPRTRGPRPLGPLRRPAVHAQPLEPLSAELFPAPVLRVTGRAEARGGVAVRCDTRLHPQKRDTPLQFAFYKYSRPVRRFDWGAEYTVPEPEVEELESYWCEAATATRSVRKRSPWLQLPGRGE